MQRADIFPQGAALEHCERGAVEGGGCEGGGRTAASCYKFVMKAEGWTASRDCNQPFLAQGVVKLRCKITDCNVPTAYMVRAATGRQSEALHPLRAR